MLLRNSADVFFSSLKKQNESLVGYFELFHLFMSITAKFAICLSVCFCVVNDFTILNLMDDGDENVKYTSVSEMELYEKKH